MEYEQSHQTAKLICALFLVALSVAISLFIGWNLGKNAGYEQGKAESQASSFQAGKKQGYSEGYDTSLADADLQKSQTSSQIMDGIIERKYGDSDKDVGFSEQFKTVYVTDSDKKYHQTGCPYLPENAAPIALGDALDQGYEPCPHCW